MDVDKARRTYDEYLVLRKKHDAMSETWRARQGIAQTEADFKRDEELVDVGRALQAKLHELNEALGQRRIT